MPQAMSASAWIEEHPPVLRSSPVARKKSTGAGDAFGNISNSSNNSPGGGGGRSGVRRIGDIFRNRLRMAGAAAIRSFNESFPQECKMHSDEESSVAQTPSPKTAQTAGGRGRTSYGELVDAVLVNERAVGGAKGRARDRSFTAERSNTLAGDSPGASAGGLRPKRTSTMLRQRTVHRTSSSGVKPRSVDIDGADAPDGTDYGGPKQQQPRNPGDAVTHNPDDAAPVEPRLTTDFHRPSQSSVPSLGGPAHRTTKRTSDGPAGTATMDEVVVGKPPSRERINSTSHYSTEKSGSSGYYSTNLYSTGGSSVDEHIYCEPIDRCDQGGQEVSQVGPPAAASANNCDKKRRGQTDQPELSEQRTQRNGRGLEQYYYPASLASPTVPVQLSVLRATVSQNPQSLVVAREECGPDLTCAESDQQQQQQHHQQTTEPSEQPLSVIMEGIDGQIPRPIWPLDTDDSLMDINLESFRMPATHSSQNLIGFESPTLSSLTDNELVAGGSRVKSTADESGEASHSRQKSQYEEYLEFHNTRNILEQIRGKLNTLLEQRAEQQQQQQQQQEASDQRIANSGGNPFASSTLTSAPTVAGETELEKNIAILKADLDGYLRTMNQKNENEIKRFCRGMSREPKVVAVQNAVEQRNRSRSGSIMSLEHDYELLERSGGPGGVPYGSVVSGGSEPPQLPYYQVMPPQEGDPASRHINMARPPAALPTAAALVLNRRSPPNPFAQEVRSGQLFLHGTVGSSVAGSAGLAGLHSLCCQQRYLSSDEIRVCNRYGGCHANVAIDMPDEEAGGGGARRGGVDDDDDDDDDDDGEDEEEDGGESFCVVSHGRDSVSIGMPPTEAEGDGDVRRGGARVKIQADAGGHAGHSASSEGSEKTGRRGSGPPGMMAHGDFSQMQRNITLERIILMESLGKSRTGQFGDKEKMLLEWHQNKPSCWELYYGANREEQKPHQTLIRKMKLGRKSTVCISYPSTRPESDFTLDVPRAEQLRLKMKKEKQFRSRCRWFFYFLSVVFFLLSVMVVSLILTRGKRMFGSMI